MILAQGAAAADIFEPLVLVYSGRMPGYADALAGIINETGTKSLVATSDTIFRTMISLPQVRCVVIAALNPSDFVFLREFAPTLRKHFEEGGAFVGLGACCSEDMEPLATTIFPIRGNATGRGKRMGEEYGSIYSLSKEMDPITSGLPSSFVITQGEYTYQKGKEGPVEPTSDLGDIKVLYREESTGIPMVVTLEREGGGRSVSLPGCYVVDVERLPFYWGHLVEQEEFRGLLKGSVSWAMEGSHRFSELAPLVEDTLKTEAGRVSGIEKAGEDFRRKAEQGRMLLLAGLWVAALVFQGFLVVRFIIPRLRSGAG